MGTHKHRAMPAEKQLRYPFKVAAKAGSFVSTKVTTGVDTTYDCTTKAFEGVKQNKYTTMVTKSITAFEGRRVQDQALCYQGQAIHRACGALYREGQALRPEAGARGRCGGGHSDALHVLLHVGDHLPDLGLLRADHLLHLGACRLRCHPRFRHCRDFRCRCECHYLLLEAHWPCHPLQVLEENLFDPAWLEDFLHRLSMDAATFASENQ